MRLVRPTNTDSTNCRMGGRLWIVLYAITLLTADQGTVLFIDEPVNYVALREIQPWLIALADACGGAVPQAVLCSHHPEVIDYPGGDRSVCGAPGSDLRGRNRTGHGCHLELGGDLPNAGDGSGKTNTKAALARSSRAWHNLATSYHQHHRRWQRGRIGRDLGELAVIVVSISVVGPVCPDSRSVSLDACVHRL